MSELQELKIPRIVRAISETPWAILPGNLAVILDIVAMRANGIRLTDDEIAQRLGAARDRPKLRANGDIAILPLVGTIAHRMGSLSMSSGGTSVEAFRKEFRALLHDPSVAAIVIDVDSPGGAVDGVPELASEIMRARGVKPISAVANTLAASAAYWIGSAADELVVSPSGEVGSIGVVAAHEDRSRFYEQAGVTTSLITAGKYKAENNPFTPLSDEGRAAIQARVDEAYGQFVTAVARQRGVSVETVRGGFGEGRVVGAREAVRLGMADRVGTIDDVIATIGRRRTAPAVGAVEPYAGSVMTLSPALTFEDQAEAALTAVRALQSRVEALTALRAGRRSPVAADNVPLIEAHRDAYREIATAYDALLASVARGVPVDQATQVALARAFLASEARRLGVPV